MNDELIEKATSVLNPHTTTHSRLFGDVGAAVESESGNLYMGTCLDVPGSGICAERAAMAAMATNREYKIKKIVAVWRDQRDGALYVLPPCGICREFMRQIHDANLDAEVILGRNQTEKLRDLLPYNEWPKPLDRL